MGVMRTWSADGVVEEVREQGVSPRNAITDGQIEPGGRQNWGKGDSVDRVTSVAPAQ